MPKRPIPVRFDRWSYEVISREAAHRGISTAEFIRVSALVAAVIYATRRGAPIPAAYPELMALVQRVVDDRS